MRNHIIGKKMLALMLAAFLVFSIGAESFAEIRLDATLLPQSSSRMKANVVLGNTALEVTFPNGEMNGYLMSYADMPVILAEFLGVEGLQLPSYVPDETISDLAMRYGKIVISVANVLNLSRKKMDYELSAFGTAPRSTVWTCSPSRRDWRKMLTKLFQTASEDEQLATLLPQEAIELFNTGLANMESILDILDGVSIQAAYDDGNIYAIRLFNAQQGICYQSYGDLSSGQHDAVVYEAGGEAQTIAVSETSISSMGFSGTSSRITSRDELIEAVSWVLGVLK